MKVLIALCLFVAAAFCATGVDVSDAVSVSDYQCLQKAGYTYVIVRCFRSTGSVDTNCASSVSNAHSAGMSQVDLYMFPCFTCGNGANQVNEVVQYIQKNGVKYTTFWFDIEQSKYWGSESANQQFFEDMINAAKSAGLTIGVYTSASQWDPIMGSSYTGGDSFPLWYAHYDNNPSFSDFQPFGGWTKPTMKQYQSDESACGVGIDVDWFPGGSYNSTSGGASGPSSSTNPSSSNPSSGNPSSGSGPSSSSPSSGSGSSGSPSSGSPSSGSGSGPASGSGQTTKTSGQTTKGTGGETTKSSSGPSSSGKTSSPSSSGNSTGPSSSGPSSGGSGNGTSSPSSSDGPSSSSGNNTSSPSGSGSGYSSGSSDSSSGGTGEFKYSENSIYSAKNRGGNKINIIEQVVPDKANTHKIVDVPEVDEPLGDEDHFTVWEEKEYKKFT